MKKYKKQLSLSIYKYYDLCYLYELYKINEGKYFHTARIKFKILGKRFRYCAKHHDSKTGKYVYPNSLPPPQRVSKTGLSYQVKIHCTGPLRTKLCLFPMIWHKHYMINKNIRNQVVNYSGKLKQVNYIILIRYNNV